ncbi:serine hydrolase [candidate division GN15 bacterium]|nr:serine hydrolase [candidate division GN15 bacterium]
MPYPSQPGGHMRHAITAACCLAVLLVFSATSAKAQAGNLTVLDTLETPAANRLAQWIIVLNSGDAERWKAYADRDVNPTADSAESAQQRFGAFQMLHAEIGGATPLVVEESEPYRCRAILQAHNPMAPDEFFAFGITVDSTPPHQTLRLSMMPARDPNLEIPEGPLNPEQIAELIDTYVRQQAADDRFSGAVLLAKDGNVIYESAFGEASKRYHVANKIDTKFNLGSMNKMFTGVAVCQLAEQGKLKFTDTVGDFLPEYPNEQVRTSVTIHQLLTHTSGLDSYWEEIFDTKYWKIRTVQEIADLFAEKPLLFAPGERFRYSNSGPIVLGLIIEAITGQSYYEYIREHVTGPAGMINTDCYAIDHPVENLAIGYTHMNYDGQPVRDQWFNNLFHHSVMGGPAGGGYSTVGDLLRFHRALADNTLLSPAYTDTLLAGKVDMGEDMQYAYLFSDRNNNGHRVVGHNGGAPGISAILRMYRDDGYTVAVLANYDRSAGQVARFVEDLIVR